MLIAAPGWDVILYIMFFGIAALYGFFKGQKYLIGLMVSLYVVEALFFLVDLQPLIKTRSFLEIWLLKGIVLVLFVVAVEVVLVRSIFYGFGKSGSALSVAVLSVLGSGLMTTLLIRQLPIKSVISLSQFADSFFISDSALLVWSTLPLVVFLLFPRQFR